MDLEQPRYAAGLAVGSTPAWPTISSPQEKLLAPSRQKDNTFNMKKLLLAILFLSSSVLANGTLDVSSRITTPSIVPQESIGIPMLEITLTTGDKVVYLDKLIFKRTGLSSSEDVSSLRATGPNFRSRSFSMLYDDTATIRFFRRLALPANSTQSLSITANLNVQGVGRTVGLELIEVISSAAVGNVNEIPSSSPQQTAIASSFSVSPVKIEKISSFSSRLRLGRWQKLEKFRISNTNDKPATLKTLYLEHFGTGALSSIFSDLILTSSNLVVSEMGNLSDNTARFSFLPSTTLDANSDRLLEVWGKVRRNKSNYTVDFRADEDAMIVK